MYNRGRSAVALLALTGLCYCSAGSGPGTSNTPKPTVTVAWISKGQCNTFFDVSRQGAKLAGQNQSLSGGATLDVAIMEPDDCTDAAAPTATLPDGGADPCNANYSGLQKAILQQAIDAKVNAIAIDVASPACEESTVNAAVTAGIPVITFDSDDSTSTRTTYYGTNNVAASTAAADMLASLIGQTGKIAIQTSMAKDKNGVYQLSPSQSYVDRMNGFTTEIATYPNIQVVATLPCVGNDVTDPFCAQQVEQQLAATPDLVGIFFARGKILRDVNLATTAPTYTAGRQGANPTLKVVAFDAPSDAVTNIQAGYADVVLNQKLFGWGYDVVNLAYDMVTIKNLQVMPFTDSGWDTICPNNMNQFVNDLTAQDFRKPLAKCMYLP